MNLSILKIATIMILTCCSIASAQMVPIDSLKSILNTKLEDSDLIKTYNKLGQEYLTINSDSTLHYSELALQKAIQFGDVKGQADAHSYIAQAYIYTGKYDLAKIGVFKAYDLYSKIASHEDVIEAINQFAVINMYQGVYDSAVTRINEALLLSQKHNYLKGQAASYNILGNIAQKKGNYPLASDYLHKSLVLYERLGNRIGLADTHNNMGVIYEYQEEYEKALDNYQKSYLVCKEIGDVLGVAIGLHNAGIILKKTGFYDSAIFNFKSALNIDAEIGALDGVAYDKKELGETYFLKNDLDQAYKYLHSALIMSASFQDPVLTVPTLIGLGNIHKTNRSYDSAVYYLNVAVTKAEESKLQNEQKEAVKSLYELFDERGDRAKAFYYFKVYTQIKDELFNEENIRKIASVEAEYKFEQLRNEQEQRVRLNDLKKDRQLFEAVWIRNTSIVGILALSALTFLIYFNYRNKRTDNAKLNKLNEEIRSINLSLEDKIDERTKQLQSSFQELDMFIYRSAHNLRAPVANMLGLCQLGLIDGESNYKEYFNKLKDTVEKMDNMLSHLQRANALKNRDLNLTNVSIGLLISDVLLKMNALSNVTIKNKGSDKNTCKTDESLVAILFENVIGNALKFSDHTGVDVSIEICPKNRKDKEIVILIKDNGSGIAENIRDQIFDMFFRGIDKQGFGLGLYEARIIMQRLNGSIKLLASSVSGSTFEIRLPLQIDDT